jgi:hypothetical protein
MRMGSALLVRHAAAVALALAALLPLHAATAGARKLQMSGTWAVRTGQVFLPLQFAVPVAPTGTPVWTSVGELSKGRGFPNAAAFHGGGAVTATGSAPRSLRIPRHRFVSDASAALPLGFSLVQFTTMLVVDAPFETATLRSGDGPGSLQWCPNDTLGCPVTGPPNGGTRNGRVIYLAGANRFGGSMQIGLASGGIVSFVFNAVPRQIGHVYRFATGPTPRAPAVGRGTPAAPWLRINYLARGVVTQPTMVSTSSGLVRYPGPKLTTMFGLTTTGAGPTFRFPGLGVSAGGMSFSQSTTEYGFGHTTGTVIVQQTSGSHGDDFFTVMGSDARTPLGAGNISTVAGGISFRNTLAGQTPYTTFHKVWMTLAPPVPTLSPAGGIAAAALVLLAAGYARRRKVGQ